MKPLPGLLTLIACSLLPGPALADEEERKALFEQRVESNRKFTRENIELAENKRLAALEQKIGDLYEELTRGIEASGDPELQRLFMEYEWSVDLLTAEQDFIWSEEDDDKLGRIKARADVARAQYGLKRTEKLFGTAKEKAAAAGPAPEEKDSEERHPKRKKSIESNGQ